MYDFAKYSFEERAQLELSFGLGVAAYGNAGDNTAASRLEACGYRPGYAQVLSAGDQIAYHRDQPLLVRTRCLQTGCLYCSGPLRWHQQHHLQNCIEAAENARILLLTLPSTTEQDLLLDERVRLVASEVDKLMTSDTWCRLISKSGGWAVAIEAKVSRPRHGENPWRNVHAHLTFTGASENIVASHLNGESRLVMQGKSSRVVDAKAWSQYTCKGLAGSSSSQPALLWANKDQWRAAVRLAHGRSPPFVGKDNVIRHLGTRMLSFGGVWRRKRTSVASASRTTTGKIATPNKVDALLLHSSRTRRPSTVFDSCGNPLEFVSPSYIDKNLQELVDDFLRPDEDENLVESSKTIDDTAD